MTTNSRDRLWSVARLLAGAIAIAWMVMLIVQPVHVSVFELPHKYIPKYTQASSGVKGQTMLAPTQKLSRIDVWGRTQIEPGNRVLVTFQLRRGIEPRYEIASGTVIFNRSYSEWQARLTFDPDIASVHEELYIRLESVLGSDSAHLHYAYFDQDIYPDGDLLELDQVEVQGQDLRFKLYRDPTLPKPLAWAEAVVSPAIAAASKSGGPPAWVIMTVMAITGGLGAALIIAASVVAAQVFSKTHRVQTMLATALVLTAIAAAIFAGAEAPIGKLWVPLS